MHRGYIKYWRKIKEWSWFKSPVTKSVFLHLVSEANHREYTFMGHKISRGQIVIGRKKLAEDLGITEDQVRTSIKRLISTNDITTKITNKFTIVCIDKYEHYQSSKSPSESPATHPTNPQQIPTIKEYNNVKNNTTEVFNHFLKVYETKRKKKYIPTYGKDQKIIKDLLQHLEAEELKNLMGVFFESQDTFVMGSDYGLGVFKSQVNKLQGARKEDSWANIPTIPDQKMETLSTK